MKTIAATGALGNAGRHIVEWHEECGQVVINIDVVPSASPFF